MTYTFHSKTSQLVLDLTFATSKLAENIIDSGWSRREGKGCEIPHSASREKKFFSISLLAWKKEKFFGEFSFSHVGREEIFVNFPFLMGEGKLKKKSSLRGHPAGQQMTKLWRDQITKSLHSIYFRKTHIGWPPRELIPFHSIPFPFHNGMEWNFSYSLG